MVELHFGILKVLGAMLTRVVVAAHDAHLDLEGDVAAGSPTLGGLGKSLGGEDDRDGPELFCLPLEHRPRIPGRQARYVDPGYPGAGGQPLGRAREREAQNGSAEREQRAEEEAPLPEQPNAGATTTPLARKLCNPGRQGGKSSGLPSRFGGRLSASCSGNIQNVFTFEPDAP